MKKLISTLLLFFVSFSLFPVNGFASTSDTYFVVTAYYSPLPDQQYYLKGNYADEIRLNGKGIAGASGKGVFSGMLAAPQNYSFGTKIYLEGLGVGSVEDRGGAIVNAGNRGYSNDRIDVWMGYGDEGLRRALYWGKRTVKGSFMSNNTEVNLDYNTIPAPLWATNGLEVTPSIFYKSIGTESSGDDIYALKLFLSENSIYSGEVNNIYSDDLIETIYDFQLETNILEKGDLHGAGYWGNQTRSKFLDYYQSGKLENIVESTTLVASLNTPTTNTHNELVFEYNPNNIFSQAIKTSQEIISLQTVLVELDLYNGEITGNYSDIINYIINFQIESNLIENKDSLAAGYYGPQTRQALYEEYLEYKNYLESLEVLKTEILESQNEILINAEQKVLGLGNLTKGQVSPEVRDLQNILKDLGYFEYIDTAIFGDITANAILEFQLDSGILDSSNDLGAGIFGPNTKTILIQKIYETQFKNSFDESLYDSDIIEELKKSSIL